MRAYRSYLITAGMIAGIILITILLRQTIGFVTKSDEFAVQNTDLITGIVLEKNDESLILEKENGSWVVNRHSEVRDNAITFFLEALSRVSIKSPVADSDLIFDIPFDSLPVVKVRISRKFGLVKSYLVYQVRTNSYGNYFKKSPKSRAYIVNIPGFQGNVGSLYTTNEKFWMPNTIFSSQPAEIRSVTVEYPGTGKSSFMLRRDSLNILRLFRFPDEIPVTKIENEKMQRYLMNFTNVRFERWLTEGDSVITDSLLAYGPQHIVRLENMTGKITLLETFPIFPGGTEMKTGPVPEADLNRVYARINRDEEFVIIRFMDIDPVLKEIDYFLLN